MKDRMQRSLCLLVGLASFISLPAYAALDTILCSPQLAGDSVDPDNPDCMDVLAWGWGLSNRKTMHISGSLSQVAVEDISVTKHMDKATPDLMLRSANGQPISRLELIVRTTCPTDCAASPYFKLVMENVIVSSVQTGDSDGGDRLMETVGFNFAKVKWCYYRKALVEGSPPIEECFGWDILTNSAQ